MMLKYAIALAIVLIVAAFFAWAFLPARHLPGNRARHLRIRLHLRLHPGKGFAHVFSLWLRWGRLAALRRSGRIRRSLPLWYRLCDFVAALSVPGPRPLPAPAPARSAASSARCTSSTLRSLLGAVETLEQGEQGGRLATPRCDTMPTRSPRATGEPPPTTHYMGASSALTPG